MEERLKEHLKKNFKLNTVCYTMDIDTKLTEYNAKVELTDDIITDLEDILQKINITDNEENSIIRSILRVLKFGIIDLRTNNDKYCNYDVELFKTTIPDIYIIYNDMMLLHLTPKNKSKQKEEEEEVIVHDIINELEEQKKEDKYAVVDNTGKIIHSYYLTDSSIIQKHDCEDKDKDEVKDEGKIKEQAYVIHLSNDNHNINENKAAKLINNVKDNKKVILSSIFFFVLGMICKK